MRGKKRLLLAAGTLAGVGAVVALAAGVSMFGLFSATETSGTNSFQAGTVTVGAGTGTTVTCSVQDLVPLDSSRGWSGTPAGSADQQQCSYDVQYTGSEPANLAVDVQMAGTADPAGSYLYDGSASGLQLQIADASDTFVSGTSYNDDSGNPVTLTTNGTASDLLVATGAATGTDIHFTIDYLLPDAGATSNNYQGAASTITLTFHAVQSKNNDMTSCTVGDQCTSAGSWS